MVSSFVDSKFDGNVAALLKISWEIQFVLCLGIFCLCPYFGFVCFPTHLAMTDFGCGFIGVARRISLAIRGIFLDTNYFYQRNYFSHTDLTTMYECEGKSVTMLKMLMVFMVFTT